MAIVKVRNQSPRCATDVEEIHRICSNAGKFWSFAFARVPSLGTGDNFPNGAAAQTACSKCQRLIEAIVQFGPFIGINKLADRAQIEIRPRAAQQHVGCFSPPAPSIVHQQLLGRFSNQVVQNGQASQRTVPPSAVVEQALRLLVHWTTRSSRSAIYRIEDRDSSVTAR